MTIQIKGTDNLNKALTAIANQGNLPNTLNRIGQYQERQFARAFAANRTPEGAPWPPLKPSTIRQKRNPKPLVEAIGRIPSSLFHEVRGNRLIVGYGDPLALIHHHGAKTKPHVIKARRAKALYWQGARHPVKQVNHPGSVIPARGLVGYSRADLQEFEAIAFEEVRRIWDV